MIADTETALGARETHPIWKLATPVEWPRFCSKCSAEKNFIADRGCIYGLIGECSACGDERIAPYTRANSEAA